MPANAGSLGSAYVTIRGDLRPLGASLDDALRRVKGFEGSLTSSNSRLAASYRALGITSEKSIKEAIAHVEMHYRNLVNSGVKSSRDLIAATEARNAAIKRLNDQLNLVHISGARNAAAQVNKAWDTLGVRSSAMLQGQRREIEAAYSRIVQSGRATAEDLVAAEKAKNVRIAELNRGLVHNYESTSAAITRAVLRIYAAYYVVSQGARLLTAPFEKGFRAVEDYKQSVAGVAALVASFAYRGAGVTFDEQWKRSLQYARELVPVIEDVAAKTLLSGEQATALANAFIRSGVFINSQNEGQVKAFSQIANALPVLTKGQEIMRQINTEIRALMTGASEQTSMLLTTLKEMDPQIKEHLKDWRRTNTVLEEVGKLLIGFGPATALFERTWLAVQSTLDTTVNRILREGMKDTFEDIIDLVIRLDKSLKQNADTISTIVDGTAKFVKFLLQAQELYSKIDPIGRSLRGAGSLIWDIAASQNTGPEVTTGKNGSWTPAFDPSKNPNQEDIDKLINKYKQELEQLNKGSDALDINTIKKLNASEAEMALLHSLQATIEARKEETERLKEQTQYIDSLNERFNEQIVSLMGGERALLEYQMAMKGLNKDTRDSILEQYDFASALKKVKGSVSEGKREFFQIYDKNQASADKKALDDLKDTIDAVADMENPFRDFGDETTDSINQAVTALSEMVNMFDSLAEKQVKYNDLQKMLKDNAIEDAEERKRAEKAVAEFSEKSIHMQLSGYSQLFGSLSQMFDENSRERKAMHTIEVTLAGIEIALQAKKALMGAIAAITAQGSVPIAGFGLVAAMAALMGGILAQAGVSLSGGGGGGAAASAPMQTNYSGTVLGDATAGSESVSNITDMLESVHADEYPELQGIHQEMIELNNNITGLVSSIVRGGTFQGGEMSSYAGSVSDFINSFADSVSEWISYALTPRGVIGEIFGDTGARVAGLLDPGGLLVEWGNDLLGGLVDDLIGSLIGGSGSVRIHEIGLTLGEMTVDSLLDGVDAAVSQYTILQKKRKKGWLSGGGTRTTFTDPILETVDEQTQRLFTSVFLGLSESLMALGTSLGADVGAIQKYVFDIGNINLRDLSAEEINDKLQAVISTAADTAAEELFTGIEQYQQVGEGLFETAARLVIDKEVVLSALDSIGIGFDGLADSLEAVDFAEALLNVSGDLEDFASSVNKFFTSFFNPSEQLAQIGGGLSSMLSNHTILRTSSDPFGLAALGGADALKEVVTALDLTTEAGREAFAAIMSNVDAFKSFFDLAEKKQAALDGVTGEMADFFHPLSDYGNLVVDVREKVKGWIETMKEWGVSVPDEAGMISNAIGVATGRFASDIEQSISDAINRETLSSEDYQILQAARDLETNLSTIAELGPDYAYLADMAQELYDIQISGLNEAAQAAVEFRDSAAAAREEAVGWYQAGIPVVQQITEELSFRSSGLSREAWLKQQIDAYGQQYLAGDMTLADWQRATSVVSEWFVEATRSSEEAASAWESAAQTAEDLVKAIDDAKASLLLGTLNVSLPSQKFTDAQSIYQQKLAGARGGSPEAVQEYLGFVSSYLAAAQENYKSSDVYQSIFESVVSEMDTLKALVEQPDYTQKIYNESRQQTSVLQSIDDHVAQMALSYSNAINVVIGQQNQAAKFDLTAVDRIVSTYGITPSYEHSKRLEELLTSGTSADIARIAEATNLTRGQNVTQQDVLDAAYSLRSYYNYVEEQRRAGNIVPYNPVGYADGGFAVGPTSGYPATLHGTELIVALDKMGRTQSVRPSGNDSRPIYVTVEVGGDEFAAYIDRRADNIRVKAERRNAGTARVRP